MNTRSLKCTGASSDTIKSIKEDGSNWSHYILCFFYLQLYCLSSFFCCKALQPRKSESVLSGSYLLTQLLNQIPLFLCEIVGELLCTVLLPFYDIFIYTEYLLLQRTHKPAEYVFWMKFYECINYKELL